MENDNKSNSGKVITAKDILFEGLKYFFGGMIIIICVLLVFKLVQNCVNDIKPLTNESEYAVYSGRNTYEYYKSILSKKQQAVYDDMKEAYLQFKSNFCIKSILITKNELKEVYRAIELDHSEIFWMRTYNDNRVSDGFIVTFFDVDLTYAYTKEEAIAIKKRIEPKYQKIIDGAKRQNNDLEKIKYVHDELVKIAVYDDTKGTSPEYQSIISIFDEGKSLCTGYAYSFKFLMDQLGIQAVNSRSIVEKGNSPKNHVWNVVKLYDKWLNVDITGDVGYYKNGKMAYKYFLKKNEDFYIDEKHLMQPDMPKN